MTDQTPKTGKCRGCKEEFDPRDLMPPNRHGVILCEPCFHNEHERGMAEFAMLDNLMDPDRF